MATNGNLVMEVVDRRFEWYEEKLMRESKIAQMCGEFEETLCGFVELFRFIEELNEAWREDVFTAVISYSNEFDAKMKGLYERWIASDAKIQSLLTFFEDQGYSNGVKGASEYRRVLGVATQTIAEWESPRVSTTLGCLAVVLDQEESKAFRELLLNSR